MYDALYTIYIKHGQFIGYICSLGRLHTYLIIGFSFDGEKINEHRVVPGTRSSG